MSTRILSTNIDLDPKIRDGKSHTFLMDEYSLMVFVGKDAREIIGVKALREEIKPILNKLKGIKEKNKFGVEFSIRPQLTSNAWTNLLDGKDKDSLWLVNISLLAKGPNLEVAKTVYGCSGGVGNLSDSLMRCFKDLENSLSKKYHLKRSSIFEIVVWFKNERYFRYKPCLDVEFNKKKKELLGKKVCFKDDPRKCLGEFVGIYKRHLARVENTQERVSVFWTHQISKLEEYQTNAERFITGI